MMVSVIYSHIRKEKVVVGDGQCISESPYVGMARTYNNIICNT